MSEMVLSLLIASAVPCVRSRRLPLSRSRFRAHTRSIPILRGKVCCICGCKFCIDVIRINGARAHLDLIPNTARAASATRSGRRTSARGRPGTRHAYTTPPGSGSKQHQ
ncbi:hypothetical protein VTI28DRAFT_3884 [Corynascus sepedonium]